MGPASKTLDHALLVVKKQQLCIGIVAWWTTKAVAWSDDLSVKGLEIRCLGVKDVHHEIVLRVHLVTVIINDSQQ